ncbi:hypothetical protein BGZ51_009281 [Haplosporangium sp. Z 767]|nr:hypothetical protein BGZ50_009369 [Haplosporangium sp. Z 11]KAF9177026.1 hypothetical protein BGZ51_009281 [Haplosporangium sp. Z 767]
MSQYLILDPAYWKTFLTPDRYTYEHIPDLTGKVAIVTGANSGLGYATTVGLAAHGAHVFMACRSEARCKEAMVRIREEVAKRFPNGPWREHPGGPSVKLEFLEVDMNDLSKVQTAAEQFLQTGLPLHLLVNNCGIGGTPWALSADGIEQQFAVNYLGPFAFTMALLDRLKESQPSRVVTVSSTAYEHFAAEGIDVQTIRTESEADMTPYDRYARSKFASILFTKALGRRLANDLVYCNVLYPGIVDTDFGHHSNTITTTNISMAERVMKAAQRSFTYLIGVSPERGALTVLHAATALEIEYGEARGKFFIPVGNQMRVNQILEEEERQEELWRFSEAIVNEKLKAGKHAKMQTMVQKEE